MRILLSQYVEGIGGSEIYLMKLAPQLKTLGVEVEFALLTMSPEKEQVIFFRESLEAMGIPVTLFLMNRLPRFSQLRKLKSFVNAGNFDLIHAHLLITDWIYAWLKIFFFQHTRIVSTKHGYEERYNDRFGLDVRFKRFDTHRLLAKAVERSITKSFAVSSALARLYTGLKIVRGSSMEVIMHGFDYPEVLPNAELRRSGHQLVLVGRLIELKGHKYALNAVAALKGKFPDIRLIVVGSGVLEEKLKKLSQELDISQEVVFTGFQKNTLEWMASSDIVLIPSLIEAFGLVLIEAMAVKKPIVAFDLPAMNEIIQPQVTGLLCPPRDQQAYTDAIEQLLSNPQLAQQMGEQAYILKNEQFSLSRMAQQTVRFYQSVLAPSN